MAKHTVIYGEKEINFELQIKNVKNINLNIKPDNTITVSANKNVPLDFIKDFVKRKGPWILKKINYFEEFRPYENNERQYVSGESFRYLGRQYRLKVRQSENETVKYFRGFIHLYVKDTDNFKRKERLFNDWLCGKADIHFKESLDRMYRLVENYDIQKPGIHIRKMKTRWGSCHRKNNTIVLNSQLIKAPKYCIDYVVLHELIHFKYKNHDNNFYIFLTSLMPDWEKRKKILDEEIIRDS